MDGKRHRFPHPQAQRQKREGLDWDSLREGYKQRRIAEGATEDELAVELIDAKEVVFSDAQRAAKSNAKIPLPETGAPKKSGPPKGQKFGGQKKDPILMDMILAAHDLGHDVTTIAQMCDVVRDTVRRYLKDQGLEPNKGKPGPPKTRQPGPGRKPPSDKCGKGHDKEPGKPCRQCDRDRKRDKYQANKPPLKKCPKCGRQDIHCHKTNGGYYCKVKGFFRGDDGS